jgi:hypothetical protein
MPRSFYPVYLSLLGAFDTLADDSGCSAVVCDEFCEWCAGLLVLRVVCEVGEFHRVGVYVEEHRSVRGVFAELGVAKLFGADGGAVDCGAVFAPRC